MAGIRDIFKTKEQIAIENRVKAQAEIEKIEASLAAKSDTEKKEAPVLSKGGLADKMAEPFAVVKAIKSRQQAIDDATNY